MNTVYEALRSLLRSKELEIKKLEKEIEALRVVLPIVAEAGESGGDALASAEAPRVVETPKPKTAAIAGPDFDSVMAQVKATQPSPVPPPQNRPASHPDLVPPKPRTSWP